MAAAMVVTVVVVLKWRCEQTTSYIMPSSQRTMGTVKDRLGSLRSGQDISWASFPMHPFWMNRTIFFVVLKGRNRKHQAISL